MTKFKTSAALAALAATTAGAVQVAQSVHTNKVSADEVKPGSSETTQTSEQAKKSVDEAQQTVDNDKSAIAAKNDEVSKKQDEINADKQNEADKQQAQQNVDADKQSVDSQKQSVNSAEAAKKDAQGVVDNTSKTIEKDVVKPSEAEVNQAQDDVNKQQQIVNEAHDAIQDASTNAANKEAEYSANHGMERADAQKTVNEKQQDVASAKQVSDAADSAVAAAQQAYDSASAGHEDSAAQAKIDAELAKLQGLKQQQAAKQSASDSATSALNAAIAKLQNLKQQLANTPATIDGGTKVVTNNTNYSDPTPNIKQDDLHHIPMTSAYGDLSDIDTVLDNAMKAASKHPEEAIPTSGMTDEQRIEINNYTIEKINEARLNSGLNLGKVGTNDAVLKAVIERSEQSTAMHQQHDVSASTQITNNTPGAGRFYTEDFGTVTDATDEDGNLFYDKSQIFNMENVKANVDVIIYGMINDDADSNWGHRHSLLSSTGTNGAMVFAGAINHGSDNTYRMTIGGFFTDNGNTKTWTFSDGGSTKVANPAYIDLQNKISSAQADVNTKQQTANSAKSALTAANVAVSQSQTTYDNLRNAGTHVVDSADVNAKLATLNSAKASAKTAHDKLSAAQTALSQAQATLAAVPADVTPTPAQQAEIDAANEAVQQKIAEFKQETAKLQEAQNKFDELKKSFEAPAGSKIEVANPAYQEAVSKLQEAQEKFDAENAKLQAAQTKLNEDTAVLENLNNYTSHPEASAQLKTIQNDIETLNTKLSHDEDALKQKQELLANIIAIEEAEKKRQHDSGQSSVVVPSTPSEEVQAVASSNDSQYEAKVFPPRKLNAAAHAMPETGRKTPVNGAFILTAVAGSLTLFGQKLTKKPGQR